MSRVPRFSPIVLALLAGALVAASCGGGGDDDGGTDVDLSAITPLPATSCGEVEYEGADRPEVLIASDLPLQGDSASRSEQQVEAIRLSLEQADWTAGELQVAFQSCDDAIAETGLWDEAKCRENAEAFVEDESVLGVIGTYNSGCAAIEIPILNRAGLALLSPGNTAVCLTLPSATCEDGQPESLYPTGDRNYARVVPHDAFQGAGLVQFAQDQGIRRPFVLHADDDSTSIGQAANFRGAARAAGIDLAGYEAWDPDAKDYTALFEQVQKSGADAIVLAGLIEHNGGLLIQNKVDVLGPNDGAVPLIAYDGFAQQSTIDEAGEAAAGMYASAPGRASSNLTGAGAQYAEVLAERVEGPLELYAPYAGEAAEVMLDAIAKGGDDRAQVTRALFETSREDGILGTYEIDANGDPNLGPVTIFIADGIFSPQTEVLPPSNLVTAAREQP